MQITIQEKILTIGEMKIGQLKALTSFSGSLKITKELQVAEVLESVIDRIDEFLIDVIFRDQEEASKIDWDDVPYSKLEEIVKGFFSENKNLISQLKSWLPNFVSMAAENHQTTTSTNTTSTPSSGTSQDETSSPPNE